MIAVSASFSQFIRQRLTASSRESRLKLLRRPVIRLVLPFVIIAIFLMSSPSFLFAQEIDLHNAAATSQPTAMDEPYSYPKILLAMILVVGLIFALKWGAGKFVPSVAGKTTKAISVLSRLPLGPKQQLMLVRVGTRAVLVASSATQMNPLCEITDADELAQLIGQVEAERTPAPVLGTFANLFKKNQDDFEPTQQDAALDRREDVEEDQQEDQLVGAARQELTGLAQRVRLLSRNLSGS